MENRELRNLIKGCLSNKRRYQKELYKAFYGFAYNITLRFADDDAEASVIMNEGFYNAFLCLYGYDERITFEEWLRVFMVQATVDYFLEKKGAFVITETTTDEVNAGNNNVINGFSYANAIKVLHQLPAHSRMVFNLFGIEGYPHERIAGLLNISVNTSEMVLIDARKRLSDLMNIL